MVASVAALYHYPVKGLRGIELFETTVEKCGFASDRRWMVVDPTCRFITQREYPAMARIEVRAQEGGIVLATAGLPDMPVPLPAMDADPISVTVWRSTITAIGAAEAAGVWLEAALGISCRLVFLADQDARPVDPSYGEPHDRVGFADGFPVLLAASASLANLNQRLASPVPMQRFRPNIVISGVKAWAEDDWRRIQIGQVVFRLPKPCTRCVVTSIDQLTGEQPDRHEPLHTLGTFRRGPDGVMFGQNLIPDNVGRIAVGDAVTVVETATRAATP